MLTESHKSNIAKALSKLSSENIEYIKENRDKFSIIELATHLRYEPIAISYNDDGIERKYYPDFLVTLSNDNLILCEIKPEKLISYNRNKIKIEAGKRACSELGWEYKLITEKVLFGRSAKNIL